jgi:tetratricopeptide (TPR) repeat protein
MADRPSRRAFLRAAAVAGASCSVPALILSIGEAATYSREGFEQFKRGRLQEAVISLSKALAFDPTNEEVLDTRSAVFEALDDHEQAIADRSEIIRLNPSAQNVLMRGVYSLGHDPDRAVADFTVVIRQEPLLADAYLFRAFAFEEIGEYDLALADYASAQALEPEDAEQWSADIARVKHLQRRG